MARKERFDNINIEAANLAIIEGRFDVVYYIEQNFDIIPDFASLEIAAMKGYPQLFPYVTRHLQNGIFSSRIMRDLIYTAIKNDHYNFIDSLDLNGIRRIIYDFTNMIDINELKKY